MRRPVQPHAHRLPPKKWEQAVFVMCVFILLAVVVLAFPDGTFNIRF